MDLIRMIYNTMDIEPSVLVHHFLRFFGFYIEANSKESESFGVESLVDIYIVGDRFVKHEDFSIDVDEEEKAILILKDGWGVSDLGIRSITYKDDITMECFLHQLVDEVADVLTSNDVFNPRILQREDDWVRAMHYIADVYADVNLLEASLFGRCFYKQTDLYQWAIRKYRRFINRVEKYGEIFEYSDFVKYVLLYARYEVDLTCKNNFFDYQYQPKMLLKECNELLWKYRENEELHLIKADILYELEDKWLDAANVYLDFEINHCGYAYYKCGRIYRSCFEEYDKAIALLTKATQCNEQYYQAWYQLGESYVSLGKYRKAIKAFERITRILREKYLKHIISPLEMEYLYKAFLRIGIIYKTYLGDNTAANMYGDMAEQVGNQHAIDNYVEAMLSKDAKSEEILSAIYDTAKERVSIKLKQVY